MLIEKIATDCDFSVTAKITFYKFGVISGSVVNLGICTLMVAALYAYHPTGPATLLIHWQTHTLWIQTDFEAKNDLEVLKSDHFYKML